MVTRIAVDSLLDLLVCLLGWQASAVDDLASAFLVVLLIHSFTFAWRLRRLEEGHVLVQAALGGPGPRLGIDESQVSLAAVYLVCVWLLSHSFGVTLAVAANGVAAGRL